MDKSKVSSEYAAQLLLLPPETIVDIIIGTIDSSVTECIEPFKEVTLAEFHHDLPSEEIINGFASLQSRFINKMEPLNSKLERFLLDIILRIPDHVLLPEDEIQRTRRTEKQKKKLLKEIENVKVEIQNAKYVQVVLKKKSKEASEVLEKFKSVASTLEATTLVFRENKTNITENIEFISSRMKTYRAQVEQLKLSLLPDTFDENRKSQFSNADIAKIFSKV